MKYRLVTATFRLDAVGNVLTVTDANTNTTNVYDDFNRLTSATDNMYNPAKVIAYTYYDDGARKQMTSPEGEVIVYTYDRARRLNSITRNSITQATYVYNKLGQRTNLYFGPNQTGAHTDYTFDGTTRWLTKVENITPTGTASSFTYELDKTGQRKKLTYANWDVVNYAYDAAYHLTAETKRDINSNVLYTNAWTYDDVGNRLKAWNGSITTTYSYNTANQLVNTVENAITTTYYTYDANGNQTGRQVNGQTWAWTYNYENLQISYTDPITTNNSTYAYDASGRRIYRSVTGGRTWKSVYDGANCIVDYDQNNSVTSQYITPFLDQNLVLSRNNATYYYMHDGLGSVRNLIDTNQVTKNSYDYTAFGEQLNVTSTVGQKFMFAGREYDSETGTYNNRWRNDDPKTGRFNRRDPMGYYAGINLYSYCDDNPVNYTDAFGLFEVTLNADVNHSRAGLSTPGNNWPSGERERNAGGITDCPDLELDVDGNRLLANGPIDNLIKMKLIPEKGEPTSTGQQAVYNICEGRFDPGPKFKLNVRMWRKIRGDLKREYESEGKVDDNLERIILLHEYEHYESIKKISHYFFEKLEDHLTKVRIKDANRTVVENNLKCHFQTTLGETKEKCRTVIKALNGPGNLWDNLFAYGSSFDDYTNVFIFEAYQQRVLEEIQNIDDTKNGFIFILPPRLSYATNIVAFVTKRAWEK